MRFRKIRFGMLLVATLACAPSTLHGQDSLEKIKEDLSILACRLNAIETTRSQPTQSPTLAPFLPVPEPENGPQRYIHIDVVMAVRVVDDFNVDAMQVLGRKKGLYTLWSEPGFFRSHIRWENGRTIQSLQKQIIERVMTIEKAR